MTGQLTEEQIEMLKNGKYDRSVILGMSLEQLFEALDMTRARSEEQARGKHAETDIFNGPDRRDTKLGTGHLK
jgi:hypothetical protein